MSELNMNSLAANALISVVGAVVCRHLILEYIPVFINRKMYGFDQCRKKSGPIPEPMGIICAAVWMTCLFLFLPIPFLEWTMNEKDFPHTKFYAFLSALLSTLSAILLGFIDDCLDLRYRNPHRRIR